MIIISFFWVLQMALTSALRPGPFVNFSSGGGGGNIASKLLPITSALSLWSPCIASANSSSLPSHLGICIYTRSYFSFWSGLSWGLKGSSVGEGRLGSQGQAARRGWPLAQLLLWSFFFSLALFSRHLLVSRRMPAPATGTSNWHCLASVSSRQGTWTVYSTVAGGWSWHWSPGSTVTWPSGPQDIPFQHLESTPESNEANK